jgi:nucleotide-binding universal stress UspA family protein
MPSIKHLLFPFDFSAQSLQVLPFVRSLATHFDATITLFSVMPPSFEAVPTGIGPRVGDTPTEWMQALQSRLDQSLGDELAGLRVDRLTIAGDPAFRIAEFAQDRGVDLIMMPTHGLGLFRSLLVGSVTSKVLHDAKCPVWTAAHAETQRAREVPKTIVCALDGTRQTPALLTWAADFSAHLGATLKLLHVVRSITDWPSLMKEQALQDQIRQEARATIESMQQSAGVKASLNVAVGEIAKTVTEEARQEGADLLIVGRGTLASPLGRLRTHAYGIIQQSPCPVLSV